MKTYLEHINLIKRECDIMKKTYERIGFLDLDIEYLVLCFY